MIQTTDHSFNAGFGVVTISEPEAIARYIRMVEDSQACGGDLTLPDCPREIIARYLNYTWGWQVHPIIPVDGVIIDTKTRGFIYDRFNT